jgi:hypothetical protein
LQGSNGEYCYLSPQERVQMIRAVKQEARGTVIKHVKISLTLKTNHLNGQNIYMYLGGAILKYNQTTNNLHILEDFAKNGFLSLLR